MADKICSRTMMLDGYQSSLVRNTTAFIYKVGEKL